MQFFWKFPFCQQLQCFFLEIFYSANNRNVTLSKSSLLPASYAMYFFWKFQFCQQPQCNSMDIICRAKKEG